jgi:hypothetical protein
MFERFVIAFALKKVGELRIDRLGKRPGEVVDLFRYGAEACHVLFRIVAAVFVPDDGEALAKRGREF